MPARALALVVLAATAGPAVATTAIPLPSFAVPGLGFLGVLATGVVAVVIGWWRMRK
jgi:hypothetical protein